MSELRELCYPGTDVLMLCFSVVRPETFRSVADRWTRAVANSRGEQPVTEIEAKVLAAKINAAYIETSAKTRKQLKDAFDAAILAGLPVVQTKKPIWKKLLCIN
ncbi:unnamed protein product [Leptidea sinapis]|uniref:Uncharacterized protein n=1 Tax=Leptidea sinapis TaxID=189913 RepID=A0A5E4R478_9NEOP|nr:unnamed protein product [Leptidea sinapis]